MFMTDVNDVKIYNLSAGKSLPEVSVFGSVWCVYFYILFLKSNTTEIHTTFSPFSPLFSFTVVNRSTASQIAEQIGGPTKAN